MIIEDKEHFSTGIFELYKMENLGISYERYIKKLEKRVYYELKAVLGLNIPDPNKFYTFRELKCGSCVKKEKDREGKFIIARIQIDQDKRWKYKIGHTVSFNVSLAEFISNIGHEMIHFYDFYKNKRQPLDHGKKFKKIMTSWNKTLNTYDLKIKDGSWVLGKIE